MRTNIKSKSVHFKTSVCKFSIGELYLILYVIVFKLIGSLETKNQN